MGWMKVVCMYLLMFALTETSLSCILLNLYLIGLLTVETVTLLVGEPVIPPSGTCKGGAMVVGGPPKAAAGGAG